jgi:hypothetical protein
MTIAEHKQAARDEFIRVKQLAKTALRPIIGEAVDEFEIGEDSTYDNIYLMLKGHHPILAQIRYGGVALFVCKDGDGFSYPQHRSLGEALLAAEIEET